MVLNRLPGRRIDMVPYRLLTLVEPSEADMMCITTHRVTWSDGHMCTLSDDHMHIWSDDHLHTWSNGHMCTWSDDHMCT